MAEMKTHKKTILLWKHGRKRKTQSLLACFYLCLVPILFIGMIIPTCKEFVQKIFYPLLFTRIRHSHGDSYMYGTIIH